MKLGKPTAWIGAAVIVVAGGYYFLKIRPKQQEQAMAPIAPAPANTINQAIENIGSKRVRAYAATHSRRHRRLPKLKKARTV